MAKDLLKVSSTVEGTKGLLKEGGSSRRAAAEQVVQSLGGNLDSFYFAFGEQDGYAIVDLPDAAAATALSLTINSTGAVQISTVALITPEEIDEACKKSATYRAPGT